MPTLLMSPEEAKERIDALRAASISILRALKIPTGPGKKTRRWNTVHEGVLVPVGVTEHYTAGTGWKGSCLWLNSPKNTGSSCHFVLADRLPPQYKDVMEDLGLPALVIQLAKLDRGTWHGNWSNGMCIGFENRNAGILKYKNGKWYWWPKNWTTEFNTTKMGKTPINIDGLWWEPFTVEQIKANIIIGQWLYCLYDGRMDRRWFIPHSGIAKGKRDTGRAFPLDLVREAIFDQRPIESLHWLAKYEQDTVGFVDDLDEDMDLEFMEELTWRQEHRDEELRPDEILVCEEMPTVNLQQLVQKGSWKAELDAVRRGLSMLGYVVGGAGPELDEDTSKAVWMFQKCMKLKTDHIPGDKTQRALAKRLKTFRLDVI